MSASTQGARRVCFGMKSVDKPRNDIGQAFGQDGYYLARGVYSEDTLRELEEDFDRVVSQLRRSGEDVNARWHGEAIDALDGGSSTVIHTHNVHRYSARWLRALQHERFLAVAQAILGPDVILHHSKLFQKPPREGAPFPVHQDWWYFPTKKDTMIAATIFLTDADERAGGFRVYPGSHKLGRLVDSSGLKPSESLKRYPIDGATPVDARRGDVLFFSYFTLHASTMNRSDNLRKTVLVQMHSGDDYVLDNPEVNHANEQLVLAGWNHYMSRAQAAKK
jgi:phytanoyl-CoA hydroxylase